MKPRYKFYFNFPTANQKAPIKYIVHKTDHVKSNSVGSSHNGIMADDFKTLDELLKALKILIRKFRKKENPHTIVYCKQCFPEAKKKK